MKQFLVTHWIDAAQRDSFWMWYPARVIVRARTAQAAINLVVRDVRRIYCEGAASTKSGEIQASQFQAGEMPANWPAAAERIVGLYD